MCSVPVVLDGGAASQLTKHVGPRVDGDPLWTARFIETDPEAIVQTHLDYLRAGSEYITTFTYQASISGFVAHLCISESESRNLYKKAVQLARHARELFKTEDSTRIVKIVGSIGSYGAHLNDGSEYSGSYANSTSIETMCEWHRPHIKLLVEAGVDLIAFETIPCSKEAKLLVELLKEHDGLKAWLSFSCKDGAHLVNNEYFQEVAKECYDLNPSQLVAIGVNCCAPGLVSQLLKGINDDRPGCHIPLVTYPNSGEEYDKEAGWIESEECKPLDMFVDEWLDLGVQYIGSCCRTTDEDIAKIKNKIELRLQKTKLDN